MDSFELFSIIILLSKILYYEYLTITQPPINFQFNTLSFGWVSEIVTIGLSPIIHPGFPCLKLHGLT